MSRRAELGSPPHGPLCALPETSNTPKNSGKKMRVQGSWMLSARPSRRRRRARAAPPRAAAQPPLPRLNRQCRQSAVQPRAMLWGPPRAKTRGAGWESSRLGPETGRALRARGGLVGQGRAHSGGILQRAADATAGSRHTRPRSSPGAHAGAPGGKARAVFRHMQRAHVRRNRRAGSRATSVAVRSRRRRNGRVAPYAAARLPGRARGRAGRHNAGNSPAHPTSLFSPLSARGEPRHESCSALATMRDV